MFCQLKNQEFHNFLIWLLRLFSALMVEVKPENGMLQYESGTILDVQEVKADSTASKLITNLLSKQYSLTSVNSKLALTTMDSAETTEVNNRYFQASKFSNKYRNLSDMPSPSDTNGCFRPHNHFETVYHQRTKDTGHSITSHYNHPDVSVEPAKFRN